MTGRYCGRWRVRLLCAALAVGCRDHGHVDGDEGHNEVIVPVTNAQKGMAQPSQAIIPTSASAAGYDHNCAAMHAPVVQIAPSTPGQPAYFDAEVPRRLHQIWYGDTHAVLGPRMHSWAHYADAYGYAYKRWGEQDDALVAQLMPEKNFQLLQLYRQRRQYKAASDVLRLSLVAVFGGIYLDSDLQPPYDENGYFDLDQWLPLRNMAVIAEGGARQTNDIGAFLTNCFLMASPGHPYISHLVNILPANHVAWQQRFRPVAEYVTGPFFLTMAWAGPVTILPMNEGYRVNLFGPYTSNPKLFGPGDGGGRTKAALP